MAVATLPTPSLTPHEKVWTFDSYLAEPLTGSYEFLDAEYIGRQGASWRHQECVGRMLETFHAFQKQSRRGRAITSPFDILIRRSPLRTRQPDVLFISNGRLAELGGIPEEGPLPGGPELAVEVLSPSETPRTVRDKVTDLAAVGTREIWLVSPEGETVQVQRLTPDAIETVGVYAYGQNVTSFTFPELAVPVADIFGE